MSRNVQFRVDTHLAALLSENYRSTEQAIKELVDNAWDADATHVDITLPHQMTHDPIVVSDNGTGMMPREVEKDYLAIASSRISRKGEVTVGRKRKVRGRKGIGKFAGLVAADTMTVDTRARGSHTQLTIAKAMLNESRCDLEKVNLPMTTESCGKDEHGTIITLADLNAKLSLPVPERLKQLLVLDTGRESDFELCVNGERLKPEDIAGERLVEEIDIPEIGPVQLSMTIMNENTSARNAGIVFRIGGKIVGKPTLLGLEDREDIPPQLRRRIIGEIEADGLAGEVTADWGEIFENSKALEQVRSWARQHLDAAAGKVLSREIGQSKARLEQEYKQRIEMLPEYRRKQAEAVIERALRRYYGESLEKIAGLVSLILDAFEKDGYWQVCKELIDAKDSDVLRLAELLGTFGLVEMGIIAYQAQCRLSFLDSITTLYGKAETLEKDMHTALERNLWVFGPQYCLMASNKTLATVAKEYLDKEFKGNRASKRPDLLLAQSGSNKRLLVEFKRPSVIVGRDDGNQAQKYRDDLVPTLGNMDILVVGGSVDTAMSSLHQTPDLRYTSYADLVATARSQLDWLLKELTTESPGVSAVEKG